MNRVDEIRTILEKRGLDGIILSDIYEVSWATGFTGDDSHCVVTKDAAVFFTDFRYIAHAISTHHPSPAACHRNNFSETFQCFFQEVLFTSVATTHPLSQLIE